MGKGEQRLLVSLDDLRDYKEELAEDLLRRPFSVIPALEKAAREVSLGPWEPRERVLSTESPGDRSGAR